MSLESFRSMLPSDWSCVNFSSECSLEEIPKYSALYQNLDGKVNGCFKEITEKICRIVNPYLYLQYLLKKEEYESRGALTVMELFHDTGANKIISIGLHNLDYRYANRVMFGKGVSFSPCPDYANKESSRSNGTDRAMIVADVLVGRIQHVNESTVLPASEYDTTLSYNNKVYVKYYDNEYYPKYVVYYKNARNAVHRRRGYYLW